MLKRMGEMMDRIKDLEEKLAKKEKDTERADADNKNDRDKDDKLKLKPIDIKDVKKPEEYSGEPKKFQVWYDRLQDLMINRHESWGSHLQGHRGVRQQAYPRRRRGHLQDHQASGAGRCLPIPDAL